MTKLNKTSTFFKPAVLECQDQYGNPKKFYDSEKLAKQVAFNRGRVVGYKLYAFKCKRCDMYHLTSKEQYNNPLYPESMKQEVPEFVKSFHQPRALNQIRSVRNF
jgi:hypothetical protein